MCQPLNTSTLSAENLKKIGLVVFEIWPGKVKSWGTFIQAGAFIWRNTVWCYSLSNVTAVNDENSFIRSLSIWAQFHTASMVSIKVGLLYSRGHTCSASPTQVQCN